MYHTMKARYLLVLFALLVALPQAMNAKKKKEVSIPVLKQPIMTTESSMVKLPKNSRVQ